MKLKDILSKQEIENYHQQWDLFKQKYTSPGKYTTIETGYYTHSGMPVISKVFQYKKEPIFRTHIFQKRLRKFDPYFISKTYIHQIWHASHYFVVMEQIYHASANLIRDNSKLVAKDIPENFEWRRPIFWDDKMISVGLILENLGEQGKYLKERGNFIFYKKNRAISRLSVLTYWLPRSYIESMKKVKQGDEEALEKLIRQIEHQDINQKRLIKPRTNLPSKDYLISELKAGRIPEEELHNFFSFWDKNS